LPPLDAAGLTIFILVLFFGVFCIIFGMPGTLIILIDAIVYASITGFEKIGLKIVIILAVVSFCAELFDFWIGMAGIRKLGLTKTGFLVSLVGGVVGAALLTPFLMGLGTLIGMFVGGFVAMLVVEILEQKKLKPPFRTSFGNRTGRIAAILVKGFLAILMTVVTMSAIYF